jgi:hypothetical protein
VAPAPAPAAGRATTVTLSAALPATFAPGVFPRPPCWGERSRAVLLAGASWTVATTVDFEMGMR